MTGNVPPRAVPNTFTDLDYTRHEMLRRRQALRLELINHVVQMLRQGQSFVIMTQTDRWWLRIGQHNYARLFSGPTELLTLARERIAQEDAERRAFLGER